jgi:RHS repeat-associated protein
MTAMPHLQIMQSDFKNQLLMTQRQAVNPDDADGDVHRGERTYYVYNGSGQRVRKTTELATGAKVRERFYLGGLEVYREYAAGPTTLERQTLHIFDDKRRVAMVETKTADVTAIPGSLSTWAIRYQFDNHLETACLELDETGQVISYEEYYPYGSTSYQAGLSLVALGLKRYRYTEKERDEESGLYYHGVRYSAPWIGRWVSCDPSGIGIGTNLYDYARINPIRYRDPDGLEEQDPNDPKKQPPPAQGKAPPPKSGSKKTDGKVGLKEVPAPSAIPADNTKKTANENNPAEVTSQLFTFTQSGGEEENRKIFEMMLAQTMLDKKLSASEVEVLWRAVWDHHAEGVSVTYQHSDDSHDYQITIAPSYHLWKKHDDPESSAAEEQSGVDVGLYAQPIFTYWESKGEKHKSFGVNLTGALSADVYTSEESGNKITLDTNATVTAASSGQLTDSETTLGPVGSFGASAALTYKSAAGWQVPIEGSLTWTAGYDQGKGNLNTSSTRFTVAVGIGKLGGLGLPFIGAELTYSNEAIHPSYSTLPHIPEHEAHSLTLSVVAVPF